MTKITELVVLPKIVGQDSCPKIDDIVLDVEHL